MEPSRHSVVEVVFFTFILAGWAGLGAAPAIWDAIRSQYSHVTTGGAVVMVLVGTVVTLIVRARFSDLPPNRLGGWWVALLAIAVAVLTYNAGVPALSGGANAGRGVEAATSYVTLVMWSALCGLITFVALTLLRTAWRIARPTLGPPGAAIAMGAGLAVGAFVGFTVGGAVAKML